jgi:hypothetical protein
MVALGMFAFAVPLVAERTTFDADVTFRRSPAFSGLEPGAFIAHRQPSPSTSSRFSRRCCHRPRVPRFDIRGSMG